MRYAVCTDKPTNTKYEEKMNKKRKTKTSLLGQAYVYTLYIIFKHITAIFICLYLSRTCYTCYIYSKPARAITEEDFETAIEISVNKKDSDDI